MTEVLRAGVWRQESPGSVSWALVGRLPAWVSVEVEPRYNAPGTWTLTVPWDAQSQKVLATDALTFDIPRGESWHRLMTTALVERYRPYADENGRMLLDLSGAGALDLLGDATAWPIPTSGLSSQSTAYYVASGPAETVLRNVAAANLLTRRGDPYVIPASEGRGASVKLKERFTNLLVLHQEKATAAGLGFRMGLVETTGPTRAEMRLEYYVPVDRSARVRLSHKVGNLRSWSQSTEAPKVTRPITGGGGKGANRIFRQKIDTAAEATYGRRREGFLDDRDTTDTAELDERLDEELLNGAAASGFELDAVEAEGMRFATHFDLGDKVKVELLTGLSSVETLNGIKFSASGAGPSIALLPGNPDAGNPMFTQAAITQAMRRRISNLERNEES